MNHHREKNYNWVIICAEIPTPKLAVSNIAGARRLASSKPAQPSHAVLHVHIKTTSHLTSSCPNLLCVPGNPSSEPKSRYPRMCTPSTYYQTSLQAKQLSWLLSMFPPRSNPNRTPPWDPLASSPDQVVHFADMYAGALVFGATPS